MHIDISILIQYVKKIRLMRAYGFDCHLNTKIGSVDLQWMHLLPSTAKKMFIRAVGGDALFCNTYTMHLG